MIDWHGWMLKMVNPPANALPQPAIHIGPVPGRTSVAIYELNGGLLTPLGYFTSERNAARALELLDSIMDRKPL